MEYSEDLAARARNSPWQCIDCKTCYICEDAGDPVSDVRKHKKRSKFTILIFDIIQLTVLMSKW